MEPIASLKGKYNSGILEYGNKLIINGLTYDSDSLAPAAFMPIHERVGSVQVYNKNTVCAGEGGQISGGVGYGSTSTLVACPNYFLLDEVSNQILIDPQNELYFVPSDGTDQTINLVDREGRVIQSLEDVSDRRSYFHLVDIGNNEYLLSGYYSNAQYTRIAQRIRYNTTTKRLESVHGSKFNLSWNNTGQYLFRSNDQNLYFYWTGYRNGYSRVTYYDKNTQAITHMTVDSPPWNVAYTPQPSQILKEDITTDVKRFYVAKPTSSTSLEIKLVSVDTVNKTITYTPCTVDSTGADIVHNINNTTASFIAFIHEFNGKRYLSIYTTVRPDQNVDRDSFRLYTFEIDANDPTILTFVGQYNFGQQVIGGHIALDTTLSKLVFPIESGLVMLNFVNNTWTDVPVSIGKPESTLYDTKGRLWVINSSEQLYLLVPETPTQIIMTFEKQTYDYIGSPIQTFVKIGVFNYLGNRVATSGTLRILSDNAEFLDGSKTTNISTNTTADTQVDFRITGAGVVRMTYEISI